MSHRISVVMPSFNMGGFIGPALQSIAAQGEGELEVVVADGGSTDETTEIIAEARQRGLSVQVLDVEHGTSPALARNRALHHSASEFVAFLDADDLWPPHKLTRQISYLLANPMAAMVSGYVRYFEVADASGLGPEPGSRTEDLVHAHLGACVYRREALEMLGPFDETLRYAEDVDLLLRLRESQLHFGILASVELYYRRHPGSMMAQPDPRKAQDFRRATAMSLARRRRAGTLGVPLKDFSAFLVSP